MTTSAELAALRQVEAATVRLSRLDGQGVLVAAASDYCGPWIFTAAHCIGWTATGAMALDDHPPEPVTMRGGQTFLAFPVFLDPVTDLAVLGPADGQSLPEDAEALESFAAEVGGAHLYVDPIEVGGRVPVQILAHTGEWIAGAAVRHGVPGSAPSGRILVEADGPIRGGTSGGPVVTADGRLLGVVSWSSSGADGDGKYRGMIPRAWLALPRWLSDQVAGECADDCQRGGK